MVNASGSGEAANAATVPARSGLGSVRDRGDIPDPCEMFSRDEVVRLTGRGITELDRDGAKDGDTVRYCQWQQDGGQLAIFLARTTASEFETKVAGVPVVDGVGQDAYQLAGHLYVLDGTVQIDVYSRGNGDDRDLADEKAIAKLLIERI